MRTYHTIRCLAAMMLSFISFTSFAVTQKEMEQARAIAAKAWMRCANNGSDYLDPIQPTSLSELEGKLKAAEKENIKKFKSVAMASDYASWDRNRLAEYWSSVFLADPSLKIENIGYAKKMTHNAVSAMKVSEPEQAEPLRPEADATTQDAPTLPDPIAQAEEVAPLNDDTDAALRAAEDSLLNLKAENPVEESKSDDGGTAIYIVILCLLVAAVIGLVIYATKVFRKSDADEDFEDSPSRREKERTEIPTHTTVNIHTPAPTPASVSASDEQTDILAVRNREIKSLMAENAELRREIEDYKLHLKSVKKRLAAYEEAREKHPTPRATAVSTPITEEMSKATSAKTRRTIYLGKAARDGIFLRAERELNPDQSLYRLISTDGLTGTFTVVDDAEVEQRVVDDPHLLDNACLCPDADTSYAHESVMTERSGTAIFESGRWRVLRKAQVRLI